MLNRIEAIERKRVGSEYVKVTPCSETIRFKDACTNIRMILYCASNKIAHGLNDLRIYPDA